MPIKKRNISPVWIMLILSLIYFIGMVFPNQQGSKNYPMLAVFEIDEFAQYPHVLQMHNPAENLKGSFRNFMVYDHYFYGYPFYFFSGLSLLPIRLVQGEGWMNTTPLIMTTLRQMVNVLPNLISIWLITFVGTKYQHFWKTAGIFLFLLISPALLSNSLWWHPDGLGLMFAALTMFFLTLDNLNFKTFFWLSAISTGIAVGIKYTGLFFVLVIPLYLVLGIMEKRMIWKKALLFALGFLLLMAASFVFSNPLLLTPLRSLLIENQKLQFDQTTRGIFVVGEGFFAGGKFPDSFTVLYGQYFLFLLLLVGVGNSLWKKGESRYKAMLLLAWILPYSWVVINSAAQRTHYWLPIVLPAYLFLLAWLPDSLAGVRANWQKAVVYVVLALLIAQSALFLAEDIRIYSHYIHKEENSSALRFSYYVKEEIVQPAFEGEQLNLYRDWHIYYPDDEFARSFMDWELAEYGVIKDQQPDFLLLERANVLTYGDPTYLENAPDAVRTQNMHLFYADALNDQIAEYDLIFEDSFGMVFQKAGE